MATLTINDKRIITDSGFSANIEMSNPAWKFDEIPGAITSDLSVKAEDNAATFKHPNRVSKRGTQDDRRFPGAVLSKDGIPLIVGTFVIDSAKDAIEGDIQSDLGKFGEEVRKKTLRELTIFDEITFENKTTFNPDSDLYCTLKILNRNFWKDKGKMSDDDDQEEELTKQFESFASFFVNQDNSGGGVLTTAGTDEVIVVSPFPFLHRLIDQILRENKFYVSDNFIKTDTELKNLCLYNNYNIAQALYGLITEGVYYPYNEYYTLEPVTITTGVLNVTGWEVKPFKIPELLPDISVKDLMLMLNNTSNVFFNFRNNRTVQIIDRESIFSMPPFDVGKYRVSDWESGTREDVILKFTWNHDSNDTAFSAVFQDLDDKREKILDPVSTLEDLDDAGLEKNVGDIRLVLSENRYYEYGWHTITQKDYKGNEYETDIMSWEFLSIGAQNYFFNDGDKGEEEIAADTSTLRMNSGLPVVSQPGNCKSFSAADEQAFTQRLLFYKGENRGGDTSNSGLKLSWQGDNGLLRNRWRLTAPFWANRLPITASFRFPTHILKYVMDNIFVPFEDTECRFLIDKLSANINNDDTTLVEIEAFKLEDNFWQYNPGTVIGGGTTLLDNAKFVGVSKNGKPYIITPDGQYWTTSAFGQISSALYADTCCVDYRATKKQLFVGGDNGMLYMYGFENGFTSRAFQAFYTTKSISSLKAVGNYLFIGLDDSGSFYYMPLKDSLADYKQTDVIQNDFPGYLARDFVYADGYYYCCTKAGEVIRGVSPEFDWLEVFDVEADFTRMAVTTDKLYVFEVNDRPFYAERSDPTNWIEYRLTGGDEPSIIEAVSGGDRVAALTNDFGNNVFVIQDAETQTRYSISGYAKGVLFDNTDIYVCVELATNESGMMYRLSGTEFSSLFSLPEGLKIMLY